MEYQNDNLKTGLENKDNNYMSDTLSFILKKTEKVVMAIYMVTDCLEDSEPMKPTLRALGVRMVSINYDAKNIPVYEQDEVYNDFMETIEEAVSFLFIAKTVGLISEMNANILENEIKNIVNIWKDLKHKQDKMLITHSVREKMSQTVLSPDFFNVGVLPQDTSISHQVVLRTHNIKDNHKVQSLNKDYLTNKNNKTSIDIKKDITDRKDKIVSLIKSKGQVSIKDITNEFKDISEKTIQRDLMRLIKDGVITKKGEKRWSVYSII